LQGAGDLTNYFPYRKITRGIDVYERNTGKRHPLAGGIKTSNTGKRATGSVTLTEFPDDLWYGTISIGTPPKTFTGMTLLSPVRNRPSDPVLYTVDFDTGSSDLFIPSTKCDSSCSGHEKYNPSASSTSHDLKKNFTLTYEDGSSVGGEQYTDVVTISGLNVRETVFLFAVEDSYVS
jgi:cathepsin D